MELTVTSTNITLVNGSTTTSIPVKDITRLATNGTSYSIYYNENLFVGTQQARYGGRLATINTSPTSPLTFAYSSITKYNGSTVIASYDTIAADILAVMGTTPVTTSSGADVATEATLTAIKSTDGIKKITDPVASQIVDGSTPTIKAKVAPGDSLVGTDKALAVSDPNVVANLSAIAGILGGTQKTKIIDNSGNVISSVQDESGNYHLGVGVIQDVIIDPHNSSTNNLTSGSTFTGTSTATTGVAAIQVVLKTDRNCTVYVEQSSDNTNWDVSDSFSYFASRGNFGITVQAVAAYARVRVTNTGLSTTTYFRLLCALCPMVESLPRALSSRGYLKTKSYGFEDEYGFEVENTPMGEMRVVVPYRLVGTSFSGSVLDTNFWTSSLGTGGTATVANAQCTLATGTTANNATSLQTVRTARYVGGSSNRYRSVIRIPDGGTANNTRKWGAFDGTDGAYFQLAGTTLSVVTIKGGSPTAVASGSFNGDLGAEYSLGANATTYEIYWTNSKVYFVIGGMTLHTISASAATWANTLHLPSRIENTNSGGSTTNISIEIRVATISRLGQAQTQPTSKYQSGTTAGIICKTGAGTLHGAIISGVSNNSVVTIYDGTTVGGTVIWSSGSMGANTTPIPIDFKAIPFFTGLFFTITTANSNFFISYE